MRQGYSRAEYMHSWQQRKTDQQTIIGGANSFFKSYPLEDQLGRACPYELSKAWVGSSSVLPGLNATTRNGVEEDNKVSVLLPQLPVYISCDILTICRPLVILFYSLVAPV
jgi:hypothetical protein